MKDAFCLDTVYNPSQLYAGGMTSSPSADTMKFSKYGFQLLRNYPRPSRGGLRYLMIWFVILIFTTRY